MKQLGMKGKPSERTLYRTLERIGRYFPVVLGRYQHFVEENGIVDNNQIIDFSSTYIEGEKAELASYGYSRDKRHMREMLKIVSKVIPENSLLIFDAGADTKANKEKIRKLGYHYLSLKAKKIKTYQKYTEFFKNNFDQVEYFEINGRHYSCIKKKEGKELLYIFFCPELYKNQIKAKERKFKRQKEKGNKILKKRKRDRFPSDKGWIELVPSLQKTLFDIENPYINGIEGFFILESSVDNEPEKVLRLYKERDKAEKFFRNLKEEIELHPVRHWNKWSVIGIFFICFLANFLINLSLTVVYPPKGFRFNILSNVSPQILAFSVILYGDTRIKALI